MTSRLLPLLILPLAVLMLQAHAIAFWTWAITGAEPAWSWRLALSPWGGWGWSVLLELLSLWSWSRWRRPVWFLVAALTTTLLLAGPLYRVSDPLLRELVRPPSAAVDSPRIALARRKIANLEASVDTYRNDWRLRPQLPTVEAELKSAQGSPSLRSARCSPSWPCSAPAAPRPRDPLFAPIPNSRRTPPNSPQRRRSAHSRSATD